MHNRRIDSLYQQQSKWHSHCPILGMPVNRVSKNFGFASWVVNVPINCSHSWMTYCQPLGSSSTVTRSLPHPENEHQRNVNNFWSCILGNQGIVRTFEHITEQLTALIGQNTIYQMKNTDSKIINIAKCKTCKHKILTVDYTILIRHYYQSAKTRALCLSKDGPTGRPADNLPNSDGSRGFHWTIRKLTLLVNWQPALRIWLWFGWDLNTDSKWWSGTVANTSLSYSSAK